ncbi:ATP-dependent helicase [Liquorilactobacillus hordei]|uniref:DNA 3'-5' helicase n=1 Tax=Liquorilactobacillus hordei DSM 19519 TaxID=1423759 RepID=A0A0R1MIU0_9LACO|nr:ATP-dependent helicase [Liquorilactobacillus hordei]KRL07911.1 ATP-dependent DNA helicase [Liquorilactobacillus hordei DSM 19519]QYH50995.1 ATP-dependent helicase [Liquorilactobacillus hordei DSM 19519]QYH51142.1 ATP-dependent helicase [Liquorilactobacillus hordei DSM 19519]
MELTKSQKEAINSEAENILVNASAGSGKTSVFTARIVNLIKNKNVDPSRILALTFTKDAANNMQKRVIKQIGAVGEQIPMSTFHSFAMKTLYSNYGSYYKGVKLMKDWWKLKLLSSIVKPKTNMNPEGMGIESLINAPTLAMFISYQKANMILKKMPVLIDEHTRYVDEEMRDKLQEAYKIFMERQKNAHLIEFDDLLLHFYYRLKEDPTFRMKISDRFDYIMVDEFQDTSKINLEILKMIKRDNLFVVGDFRQSIYSFINADINNILNFSNEFKDVHVIELQENFRSTKKIVDLSNSIITSRNVENYKKFKNAKSAIGIDGNETHFKIYSSDRDEVDGIIEKIKGLVAENYNDYRDFAILVRTNSQMGVFESAFADAEIPLNVSGNHSFFERTEIDVLLSYLRIMNDHADNQSMARIINTPNRFISNKLQSDLDKYAYNNNISVFKALSEYTPISERKPIEYLINILTHFDKILDTTNAGEVLQYVIQKTKYFEHLEKTSRKETERVMKTQSVESLLGLAHTFGNIEKLLNHIDIIKNNNKKNNDESVNLMTVHASKGLEFDHVFLPSVSDEYYPHEMCNGNIEEEARLLYVAISRAKYNLDLSYNIGKKTSVKPTRFLTSIYPDLLKKQKLLYQGSTLVEV